MELVYMLWTAGFGREKIDPFADLELFDGIDSAVQAFRDRYRFAGVHPVPFNYVNRPTERVMLPSVKRDSVGFLFSEPITDPGDVHPDAVVTLLGGDDVVVILR